MTARLDPTIEKLILVAVTLRRRCVKSNETPLTFMDALYDVCVLSGIHLHPRVCEQLEKDHGHK